MKTEGVLSKDFCPKWLRLSSVMRLRIGATVMVGSVLWCVAAPWLSANHYIGVLTELNSYWLAGVAFLIGARYFLGQNEMRVVARRAFVSVSLILFLVLWFESDRAFFFWKVESMRPNDWSEAISYL